MNPPSCNSTQGCLEPTCNHVSVVYTRKRAVIQALCRLVIMSVQSNMFHHIVRTHVGIRSRMSVHNSMYSPILTNPCRRRPPHALKRVGDDMSSTSHFFHMCDGGHGKSHAKFFTRCPHGNQASQSPSTQGSKVLRLPPRGRPTYRQVAWDTTVHWV